MDGEIRCKLCTFLSISSSYLPSKLIKFLQKRRRRKWIAPNGKSCDSIPKAIAISVEIGLLPPDTKIPVSNKKRQAGEEHSDTPVAKKHSKTPSKTPIVVNSSSSFMLSTPKSNDYVKDVVKQSSSQKVEIITPIDDVESDPEDSLRPTSSTVHYDPTMGKLVGWRIRIWDTKTWRDGRIILYDSYTNKHKVRMKDKMQGLDAELCVWLRLIHEVSFSTSFINTFLNEQLIKLPLRRLFNMLFDWFGHMSKDLHGGLPWLWMAMPWTECHRRRDKFLLTSLSQMRYHP
jgi:hypothetical protein